MIGVIGGSGFYDFLEDISTEIIYTPFGDVTVELGKLDGKDVLFIPRHGKYHSIPPHQINYRANIYAAHVKKVKFLIATNAAGALNTKFEIGSFSVADHILDFTTGRISTYFDGSGFSVTTNAGNDLSGVVHTDVTHCFDQDIRKLVIDTAKELDMSIHDTGTMVVSNGPRFESPAEIIAFGKLGGDYVGMTSAPEVFLAKELEIPYCSIVVITNYGAGLQKKVSTEEVFAMFSKKIVDVMKLVKAVISNYNST